MAEKTGVSPRNKRLPSLNYGHSSPSDLATSDSTSELCAPPQVIVVMGYPTRADGKPSRPIRERVREGVRIYRERPGSHLLFSGGAVYNPFVEATVMAELAHRMGVPAEDILVETESRNTPENIRFSAHIMRQRDWRSAVVVTNYYNTPRVATLFLQEGIHVLVTSPSTSPPFADQIAELVHMLWHHTVVAVGRLVGAR